MLRSIAAGNGPIDPHWPLHNHWAEWMQPGRGEASVDRFAEGGAMMETLVRNGFRPEDASANSFVTPGNARRILELYRSAIHIGRAWSDDLARIVVPSMIV